MATPCVVTEEVTPEVTPEESDQEGVMAEEATPSEMPVGCLEQSLPLTATMPCSSDDGSPHTTKADPGMPAAATDPPPPALDGPAGSVVPQDAPETTERETRPVGDHTRGRAKPSR